MKPIEEEIEDERRKVEAKTPITEEVCRPHTAAALRDLTCLPG